MKIAQLVIALVFCSAVAYLLGMFYVVPGIVALLIALGGGVVRHGWHRLEDVVVALGVGLVWPVVVIAYGVYAVDSARTAKLATSTATRTTETSSSRVEDLHHSEERDQR